MPAERAIKIWPAIEKFVRKIGEGPKSKIPKTTELITLQEAIQDPLTTAKLQFFITQAQLLKPYLKKYQSESPMMPFMAEDLYNILESTMEVCKEVSDRRIHNSREVSQY